MAAPGGKGRGPVGTEYKFKITEVSGIPYRFPQIDLSKYPFNGIKEDRGYGNRAETFQKIRE